MCNIVSIQCHSCKRMLSVHIGDFCTRESNVMARCGDHAPNTDDGIEWTKFVKVFDKSYYNGKIKHYGDWYLAVRNKDMVDPGYGFDDGGICPNTTDWELVEVAP